MIGNPLETNSLSYPLIKGRSIKFLYRDAEWLFASSVSGILDERRTSGDAADLVN